LLELEQVVKHYRGGGEEVHAVAGIDLTVRAGEMVALHGPSGSGKTTLLKLAATLLAPDRGAIRFDGTDLATFSEDDASDYLMRDVGFVYQSAHLMPRVSALENAAIKLVLAGVRRRDAEAQALDWLDRLGLSARARRSPEQLSGGERQRVALARALCGDPRLILADEPTGNLDSARSHEIIALLSEIAHQRGAAVLLVTHDTDAARLADHLFELRDGELRPTGSGPAGGNPIRVSGHPAGHPGHPIPSAPAAPGPSSAPGGVSSPALPAPPGS
jgi:putative ABC transport system ATP-binding protein